jgi:hypothetical protein
MDTTFNYPSDFVYNAETCEVESVEEHFISNQCALNFIVNTSVVGTCIVNSMEDKPCPLAKDVFNFGIDDLSYHLIQDGLDKQNKPNFIVGSESFPCFWLKGSYCKTRKIL